MDVPGHPRIREQFREHLADAKAIVFVVDASNVSRNGPIVAEYVGCFTAYMCERTTDGFDLKALAQNPVRCCHNTAVTKPSCHPRPSSQMRPTQDRKCFSHVVLGTTRNQSSAKCLGTRARKAASISYRRVTIDELGAEGKIARNWVA